jgi:tetratricopeptide (TPR) repeat protein
MRTTLFALVVGCAFLAGTAALGLSLETRVIVKPYDVLHVPSGPATRIASLGNRTFVSDLYWLDAVQYIGDPKAERRGFDKLYPLIDLVTDLDPRHGYAYQTAGIVLSAAGLLDESDAILKKGMEKGPPTWTFPYYLAFNAWFYRGNLAEAARYAEMAARAPGASPNISHLALALASKSGTPEDAVALLEELRGSVKDEVSAARLDEQLKLALLERDAQKLEAAIARFEEIHGNPPADLRELVADGLVPSIPDDPFGGHYLFDPKDGKVHSSANPFRFKFFEGAHRPRFKYEVPGEKPSGVLK